MDILIPAINNDIPMLEKTISSVRLNVKDGVDSIFVIAPENYEMKSFCNDKDVVFINEIEAIGYSKNDFNIGNVNRNGWLYQQLLKLNGDKVCNTDNYLVIDADHVLVKEHNFISNDKFVFYMSTEFHQPYFIAIYELFNGKYKKIYPESFISDKMVMNKMILKEMKDEIEGMHEKRWDKAIIDCYYRASFCGFSEFETYGTYISNKHKDKIITEKDERLMVFEKRVEELTLEEIMIEYSKYKSITEFRNAK